MINLELFKRLKVSNTDKGYMHTSESILENEIDKVFWDFQIQTDHLVQAQITYRIIINKKKKTCSYDGFSSSSKLQDNFLNGKNRTNIRILQESWKKLRNMKVIVIPIIIGALGT